MSTSCPGFLDQYGIWNNGFDCSSSLICCGIETNRYCCIPSSSSLPSSSSFLTSSSIPYQSFNDLNSYTIHTSNNLLSEKWFFLQICIISIFLAIIFLIFAIIYLCLTSIRHNKKAKKLPIVQIPFPSTSPFLIEQKHSSLNRISTITNVSNDVQSRCTDTSIILNTPLNLYPTTNSRNSTSSSYYIYPNEFEYLCR